MKFQNAIYYTPYKQLQDKGVSFADYSKGKNYYTQLAPLFNATNPRKSHTKNEVEFLILMAQLHSSHTHHSFLDVACGTDRHVKELLQKGQQVVGVDSSKSLLRIARAASPEARFVRGDMRFFKVDAIVDCVYSLWDSYVYLSQPEDISAFARQCSAHLKRGGILVLDSKNYQKQQADIATTRRVNYSDNLRVETIIRRAFYREDKVYEAVFTSILQDIKTGEAHVIVDQTLARVYSALELERLLQKQGFQLVKCYGNFKNAPDYTAETSERLIAVFKRS